MAGVAYFQIALDGGPTGVSTLGAVHTSGCAGSAWVGLLIMPTVLPAGLYHLHAYIDGSTAEPSAAFRVG